MPPPGWLLRLAWLAWLFWLPPEFVRQEPVACELPRGCRPDEGALSAALLRPTLLRRRLEDGVVRVCAAAPDDASPAALVLAPAPSSNSASMLRMSGEFSVSSGEVGAWPPLLRTACGVAFSFHAGGLLADEHGADRAVAALLAALPPSSAGSGVSPATPALALATWPRSCCSLSRSIPRLDRRTGFCALEDCEPPLRVRRSVLPGLHTDGKIRGISASDAAEEDRDSDELLPFERHRAMFSATSPADRWWPWLGWDAAMASSQTMLTVASSSSSDSVVGGSRRAGRLGELS